MKSIYKNNVRLNDYQGVQRLLSRVTNAVIQDEIDTERAKVISTLCNTLLKALEGDTNELEQLARIEGVKATTERTKQNTRDESTMTQEDKLERHFEKLGTLIDGYKVEDENDIRAIK